MSARALTPEDIEELRAVFREEVRLAAEVLEARMRGQRVKGKRRFKAPELAAQIAREIAPADDIAKERGRRAVEKLRKAGR